MSHNFERIKFIITLFILLSVVFGLGYLIGTSTELRVVNLIVIASTLPMVVIIFFREKDIKPRYRWRLWYTVIISFLLVLAVSLIYIPSGSTNIPISYKEAQASLGYFMFYLVLILPVLISCIFQRGARD